MNKVIDYNYYLNLSNQLLLNYFRWSHDNNVFFLNFGPLHNFGKGEARHFKFGTQTDYGKF